MFYKTLLSIKLGPDKKFIKNQRTEPDTEALALREGAQRMDLADADERMKQLDVGFVVPPSGASDEVNHSRSVRS